VYVHRYFHFFITKTLTAPIDTRYDVGKRYSVFYILGSLASACAGILAYGLMQLKGREGLNGWRCKLEPTCDWL
jgi:hypothetical protein